MKFWEINKRKLKEIYRNTGVLGFLIGMPLAFMLVFCYAFGNEHTSPTIISVVDEDGTPTSAAFINCLESIPAVELNTPVYITESTAKEDMEDGNIPFYLLIPEGFEQAKGRGENIDMGLTYQKADPMIGLRVTPVIEAAASQFWGIEPPITVTTKETELRIKNETVNFYAPGIVIFGLMILIPTGAMIIAGDREKGLLSRLLTTPARPWEFIVGYGLPFVPVLIISSAIYIGVGMAMCLTVIGSPWIAFLLFFTAGICSIGIAMIIGTLIRSQSQSALCYVFIVPLAMISGAWFSVDGMPEAIKAVAEALPFIHAIDASRSIINGAAFAAVLPDFYWIIGWAIAFFAAGIILFRMKMES
jgi:ABC-2 type transport system permease protein